MKLGLSGKTVAITGGVQGIGLACARAFLEEGCNIAVCARSEEKILAFRNDFSGDPIFAQQADVAQYSDINGFALAVAEHFGGIDVWINSAGLYPSGELLNCTREKWDALASINIAGALHGAQVATPHLKRRGGGVIVNISSYAAIIPTAGRGAYGMTKAALSSMTRTLAAELAPLNIRVVAVLPGMIFTPLTRDVAVEEKIPELSRRTALNRLGVPEDVAPAVVFLSSDAASYITGCGLEISGGKYCVQNPDAAWERA